MNLTGDNGRKSVAITARKTKPDGTHEISHRVEHHDMVAAIRRQRPIARSKAKPIENDYKPMKYRDTTQVHHHIAGVPSETPQSNRAQNFADTLNALRNAMAGDGRLE